MLVDPSKSVSDFMQLTPMQWDFKLFILALGVGYISLSWASENFLFPRLAKAIGVLQTWITKKPKERKKYKLVLEEMQMLSLQ